MEPARNNHLIFESLNNKNPKKGKAVCPEKKESFEKTRMLKEPGNFTGIASRGVCKCVRVIKKALIVSSRLTCINARCNKGTLNKAGYKYKTTMRDKLTYTKLKFQSIGPMWSKIKSGT